MKPPVVQVAIDVTSLDDASRLIDDAIAAGADWIELGKPLIEFAGLRGLLELRPQLEGRYVVADAMILSAPEKYLRAAQEAGASNVTVTALAPRQTVVEAIEAGKRLGVAVTVDLFNVGDVLGAAQDFARAGADYLMVHFGVDQKRAHPDGSPIETLRAVVDSVDVPVSYATYDLDESRRALDAGASVIVQGEPLLSAPEPRAALRDFIRLTHSHAEGASA
jgi:3-keto-L-gulonate-6-phosphate decarboxylase